MNLSAAMGNLPVALAFDNDDLRMYFGRDLS